MRKVLILTSVLFFFVFAAMVSAQTQSGQWLSKAEDKDYSLDKNNGERSTTVEISFAKPFDIKPKVTVSVSHLDADKGFNSRYSVEVLSVSRDGFTIKIKTWADTKIFSIGGYWLAYKE